MFFDYINNAKVREILFYGAKQRWGGAVCERVGEDRVEVERFPYLLANVAPKWGSKVTATIYVEKDGKGLLIAAPTKHLYYRLDESILQEVTANEEN